MIDSLLRDLILGVIVVAAIRLAMLARGDLPAGYGAIVMAICIFARAAWHRLPFATGTATEVLALALIASWLAVAASYVGSALRGAFHSHYDDPVARFAIGTWVAGTAVMGVVIQHVFPSWRPLVVALTLVALLAWVWFLALAARGARAIVADPLRNRVTGIVLLAAVSTQSVAILTQVVTPAGLEEWIYPALIALGCAFYGGGVILIARRYWRQHGWRLADDWHNTNCIIHGAVSITGLAAVSGGALPIGWIVGIWLCALLLFVAVEGIELARLHARVEAYGWRRGALTYNVSQWARNFTFGMFYAFTLALYNAEAGGGVSGAVRSAQAALLRYGQYAVLALLVLELVLFLARSTTAPTSTLA